MTALVPAASLPPCSSDDLALVMALRERIDAELEPCEFPTENFFHAGVYVRTCLVPKDTVLAGAVIKIPTVVIVSGHCYVQAGKDTRELKGYVVLKGAAGRAQVFRAIEDTFITMLFASDADSIERAEEEFTDEFENLLTRRKP